MVAKKAALDKKKRFRETTVSTIKNRYKNYWIKTSFTANITV